MLMSSIITIHPLKKHLAQKVAISPITFTTDWKKIELSIIDLEKQVENTKTWKVLQSPQNTCLTG